MVRDALSRSSPRKRGPRANLTVLSAKNWVPASAGTNGREKQPPPSNRERLVRRGVEHLLRRHQARREALGMMMAQERLQHVAVGREAVRPEIVPHQLARRLELLVDERQRALAGGGVLE